jgi:hypothetical protein
MHVKQKLTSQAFIILKYDRNHEIIINCMHKINIGHQNTCEIFLSRSCGEETIEKKIHTTRRSIDSYTMKLKEQKKADVSSISGG